MKNLIVITFLLIVVSSCALFVSPEKMPFKVTGMTEQTWVAGVKAGGRGTNYAIDLKMRTEKKIKVDTVWMNGYAFRPKLLEPNEKMDHHRLIMTKSETPTNPSENEENWKWRTYPPKAENPPHFDGTAMIIYRFNGERRKEIVSDDIERKEPLNYP